MPPVVPPPDILAVMGLGLLAITYGLVLRRQTAERAQADDATEPPSATTEPARA